MNCRSRRHGSSLTVFCQLDKFYFRRFYFSQHQNAKVVCYFIVLSEVPIIGTSNLNYGKEDYNYIVIFYIYAHDNDVSN